MKKILQNLCDYVTPSGLWASPKDVPALPYMPLVWKGVVLMLAQIALVAPLAIFAVKTNISQEVFVALLILPSILLEVLTGGVLIKWYYAGIKNKFVLVHSGKKVDAIPYKPACKMAWAFSWRIWFIKLMFFTAVWVALVVIGAFVPALDAPRIITSESFSKILLQYDALYMFASILVFFPRIRYFYPDYHFRKVA